MAAARGGARDATPGSSRESGGATVQAHGSWPHPPMEQGWPRTPTRERWTVRMGFDRSAAAERASRAWIRRLLVIDSSKEHSPWLHYLSSVYGTPLKLPIDLRAFKWFWWWAPGTRNLTRFEVPVWRTLRPGDVWLPGMRIERHLSQAGFFVQMHQEPCRTSGFTDGSKIEVMRVSHPPGEGPHTAYGPEAASTSQVWYWHAPGSGIYLSLGRSLAVANRTALIDLLARHSGKLQFPFALKRVEVPPELGLRLCEGCTLEQWVGFDVVWVKRPHREGHSSWPQSVALCDLIRAAGYDTVQLFAAFGCQRYEIIDCRRGNRVEHIHKHHVPNNRVNIESAAASWTAACPPLETLHHLVRPGPNDGWATCACSTNLTFLNCGQYVVPASVLRLAQPSHNAFMIQPPH